jgi:hypothetical protein
VDRNFWFYALLGLLFVGTNVITYVLSTRKDGDNIDLQKLVESAVFAAEQIIPGETGAAKYAFVMHQLQAITKIDDTQLQFVKILIEGAVKKLHLAEGATKPAASVATMAPAGATVPISVLRGGIYG